MLIKLVLTRATWRHIPDNDILHSHCFENLKSYKLYVIWKGIFSIQVYIAPRPLDGQPKDPGYKSFFFSYYSH
jgi:hypothetical protein